MELISISAGALGASFLKEGITFLWNQAGKIIDRYHEKKKIEKEKKNFDIEALARIEDKAPKFIEINPVRVINFAVVEKKMKELKELRKELFTYASGDEEITIENKKIFKYTDQLQQLLCEIFAEDVSVPQIKVRQFMKNIEEGAEVIGLKAGSISKGSTDVNQQVNIVKGNMTGIVVEDIK